MRDKKSRDKLRMWQDRLSTNESAYAAEIAGMDNREALYQGKHDLSQMVDDDRKTQSPHVRNICAELIESQVSSSIPQPKVTARREKDENLAKLIEDMLRNELDRMAFERINDLMERTVPIQGGSALLVEWDNRKRTHETVGELTVSMVHPKQIIPQDGVVEVQDMDYIIIKVPQTKESIRRQYGVDLRDEGENEPEIRSADGESPAADMVTQYMGYYRNDNGGIGLYSWVNDVELEDLDDYQARRLRRCKTCGAVEPMDAEPMEQLLPDGNMRQEQPEPVETDEPEREKPRSRRGRKACPYCGGTKWEDGAEDYEELTSDIVRSDGSRIPAYKIVMDVGAVDPMTGLPMPIQTQEPSRIPYYKPDMYPLIVQKNVSLYGRFMGDSDLDKIADQQNTINRMEAKIIDKILKSGSYTTIPNDATVEDSAEDMKVFRVRNPADKNLFGVYTMEGDVSQDMAYMAEVYEEARQTIGITDSFQGRRDTTATSGKAKEFSAAQSAGRLESKRVMKDAAYAELFEAMFKFKLAYADEPRPVVSEDIHGNTEYKEFNRYDFLEQDEAGEWAWNDQFLFSCDTSAPLASNREAMWQETRMNLQTGAFGDPANPETLILFWTKMEMLHYPGASETRGFLEEQLQRQQQAQMQQMMMQQQQQQAQMQAQTEQNVIRQAQADAARDLGL